jgi:hypothetical protein
LFALVDVPAGATLCTAAPVVAHPPHALRHEVCHHCLRALPAGALRHLGELHCSPACAADAEVRAGAE